MSTYTFTNEHANALIRWYKKNHRDLPWRHTHDAYHIWVSEIMLQQTRVEAVIEKYNLFMETLPTISDLAEVDDDRLMKLWEGMGYYSRARNLKKCAQVIMQEYQGKFPLDYKTLLKLPGIGPYTAGAISSIAYGKGVPAVDGNVLRVLARLFGIREDIRSAAVKAEQEDILRAFYSDAELTPTEVRSLTQGFMDLGAGVCVPNGEPHCDQCPWQNFCYAHQNLLTKEIPFRSSLKARKILNRTILLIRDGDRFLIRKRPATGLLAGLYEFPGIDAHLTPEETLRAIEDMGLEPIRIHRLPEAKHIFSHLEWHMIAFEVQVSELHEENALLVKKKELQDHAIPSAFQAYLDYYALRD